MSSVRVKESKTIDKTLYLQCREYVKLSMLIEELQCFQEDGGYFYEELIDATEFKAGLLLIEIRDSIKRIESQKADENNTVKETKEDIINDY